MLKEKPACNLQVHGETLMKLKEYAHWQAQSLEPSEENGEMLRSVMI